MINFRPRGLLRSFALAATLVCAPGCVLTRNLKMPALAHAEVASDFETYDLHRVGLMPVAGLETNKVLALSFQLALQSELSHSAPYEVVVLNVAELEAVEASAPYLKGSYKPRTILALSQRYHLDALLFPTVTQHRDYPPQELGVVLDLVAAETGLVLWSGHLHLDANDRQVVTGLKVYYRIGEKEGTNSWELSLLSPERFSRFAAYQLALLL